MISKVQTTTESKIIVKCLFSWNARYEQIWWRTGLLQTTMS